jgi:hypothetical protein
MPQRKLIKDIWFLRSTKMVLGRFENNLLIGWNVLLYLVPKGLG